jgi:anti-sigma factor RsiW
MIDPLELHAYADGELSKEERGKIEERLRNCAESRREIECIQNLKRAIRSECKAVECEAEWGRCTERIRELNQSRRATTFVSRYAWAMCAVFFVFILAGAFVNRTIGGSQMQGADLARVVSTLAPVGGPASQEPEAIGTWLDSLLGHARHSVSPDRLDIRGAQRGEIDGHPVVQLQCRDAAGDMSLLIVNGILDFSNMPSFGNTDFRVSTVQGMNCLVWTDGRFSMALVGNRPYQELHDVVARKIVIE